MSAQSEAMDAIFTEFDRVTGPGIIRAGDDGEQVGLLITYGNGAEVLIPLSPDVARQLGRELTRRAAKVERFAAKRAAAEERRRAMVPARG